MGTIMSDEYKERKSQHYRTFHLPEKNGHQVGIRLVGPIDQESLLAAKSLEDVGKLLDPQKPVLLHWTGGPGLATPSGITRVINTRHFNLLLVSYRGTVDSLPHGRTEYNTTQDIIDDGKRVLEALNINNFYMSGFCFGTLISTVMASQMNDRCKGLGLFFPYTSSALDDKWLFEDVRNANLETGKLWQKLNDKAALPPQKQNHIFLIDSYRRAVENNDLSATKLYAFYQGSITGCIKIPEGISIDSGYEDISLSQDQKNQVSMELHYAAQSYFLGENGVIPHMPALQNIPMHIVYSSQNKSFHPNSIDIWKDNCPKASYVDTMLPQHHLLDSNGNRKFAKKMFDFLESLSKFEQPMNKLSAPALDFGRPSFG